MLLPILSRSRQHDTARRASRRLSPVVDTLEGRKVMSAGAALHAPIAIETMNRASDPVPENPALHENFEVRNVAQAHATPSHTPTAPVAKAPGGPRASSPWGVGGGPGSGSGGAASAPDITKYLPAPYNKVIAGSLIAHTNRYSYFQEGGINQAKGTSLYLGYVSGNPYTVTQYYWSVYIHSPVLGNLSYQEVDPSPYGSVLPQGVAAFINHYKGYL